MHSLDPRTRIILGIAGLGTVLTATRVETALIQAALVLSAILIMRSAKKWAQSMRLLWPTMVMVLLVVYLSFDIRQAIFSTTKLFNLLTVSFFFFSSISPEELSDALRKMHVPYGFSFILTTAMRYVPLIGQKTRNIMDAQMSRGIDLRFRPKSMKNIMALVFPLAVQSFMLSDQLAMAMEMRGFSKAQPTLRRNYQLKSADYVSIILALSFLIAFAWWEKGWFL